MNRRRFIQASVAASLASTLGFPARGSQESFYLLRSGAPILGGYVYEIDKDAEGVSIVSIRFTEVVQFDGLLMARDEFKVKEHFDPIVCGPSIELTIRVHSSKFSKSQ